MKAILILSLILVTFYLVNCKQTCNTYTCDNTLTSPACAKRTDTDNYSAWSLAGCTDPKTFCQYLSADKDTTVSCTASPTKNFAHYPGGSCTDNPDCIPSTPCINNICTKLKPLDTCASDSECPIGYACFPNLNDAAPVYQCNKQLSKIPAFDGDKSKCENDFDCINTMGCLDGFCVEYYSLELGTELQLDSKYLSYCKSGQLVKDPDTLDDNNNVVTGKLKCREIFLDPASYLCTETQTCKYSYYDDKGNKVDVFIPEKCECSFNGKGDSYCQKGNEDVNFNLYRNSVMNDLLNPKCHAEERFDCSNTRETKLKNFQFQENNRVDILNSHLIEKSDACTKIFAFPEYTPNLAPNNQCPKFSCATNADTCVSVNAGALDGSKTVTLSKCTGKNSCNNTPDILQNFNDYAYTSTCVSNATTTPKSILPGESCQVDADCIEVQTSTDGTTWTTPTSKCIKGKCNGAKLDEFCQTTLSCVVGLFCYNLSGRCEKLQPKKGYCSSTEQCSNNLFCYNGHCTEYFSLVKGTNVSQLSAQDKLYACASGTTYNGLFCSSESYVLGPNQTVTNGVIGCKLSDTCSYSVDIGSSNFNIFKPCQCGFNSSGNGYCPIALGDKSNTKTLKSFTSTKLSLINSARHSLGRYSDLNKITKANTNADVRFYNAIDCVYSVLGSGASQFSSLIGIFALAIAFLFL